MSSTTDEQLPYWLFILLKVFLALISSLGIFGNIMTFLAVATNKQLWTAPNSFVVNLSVADFLVCGILIPYSLFNDFGEPSSLICQVMGFPALLCLLVSVGTLCMIAVNRYIYICMKKQTYLRLFNPRMTIAFNAGIWVITSIIISPPFYGWGDYGFNREFGSCIFINNRENYFFVLLPDFVIIFPTFAVTSFCYVNIARVVYKAPKPAVPISDVKTQPKEASQPTQLNLSVPTVSKIVPHPSGEGTSSKDKKGTTTLSKQMHVGKKVWKMKKVLLNMFLMWLFFMLCWMPLIAVHKIDFKIQVSRNVYHILYALAEANSAVNFVLYAALNRNFRDAYKKMLWKLACCFGK